MRGEWSKIAINDEKKKELGDFGTRTQTRLGAENFKSPEGSCVLGRTTLPEGTAKQQKFDGTRGAHR